MAMDQIISLVRTKSLSTQDNGIFIVVPNSIHALAITDILLTIKTESTEGELILQLTDGTNTYVLADLDVASTKTFNHSFAGMPKFWNGARFEVIKNFEGSLTLSVSYLKITGFDWSIWNRQ